MNNQIRINDLIRIANKAGYRTYLKNTSTVRVYGNEEETTIYTLGGSSWETSFDVKESELANEYEVFEKIINTK